MKVKLFFSIFLLFLIVFLSTVVYAQIVVDCSSNYCSFTIDSQYTTASSMCESRSVSVTVNNCDITISYFSLTDRYYLCNPIFYIEKDSNNYVVLARGETTQGSVTSTIYPNVIICSSQFCSLSISCDNCTWWGSLNLMPPNCGSSGGGGGGSSGGGSCNCDWWNIPCHLSCIFSWVIDSVMGLLQGFFNWIKDQIINALPQPIRDFFAFMGQLFGFLGQLIVQMMNYTQYFMFATGLIFTFGFIYYIVEYGAVGIGMYFEMLYDLFRKFIDLIIKVIDVITPF